LRDEQHDLIMTTRENPQGEYATEGLVRRLTENIGKKFDHDIIEPPVVMDQKQTRMFRG